MTTASKAATQTTPGPMARSNSASGPTASGNRVPTATKNTSPPKASIGLREAARRSRSMIELNAARIGKLVQVQGLRAPAGAADVAMSRHYRQAALPGVQRQALR